MESLYPFISRLTGLPYDPLWAEKLPHVILGMVGFILFCVVFILLYRIYLAKHDPEIWHFFIVTAAMLGSVAILKYILYFFAKGYWPDRLLFYSLPSPRLASFWWLAAACAIAGLFVRFHSRLDALKRWQFLLTAMAAFVFFTLAVAGLRGGVDSIIHPLTRTYWEYTGALPFIKSPVDFLRNFIALLPQLPVHARLHPPGYPLVLYFFQQAFSVGLFGMAMLLVLTASTAFIPVFYVARRMLAEYEARSLVKVMVFLPALVFFSATSMEAVFVAVVSFAVVAAFFGWKENILWSIAAGALMAVGVLCNFLFLLLGLCFLSFLAYHLRTSAPAEKSRIIFRAGVSGLVFVSFFVLLWIGTGYSVVDNFFASYNHNKNLVASNFLSFFTYIGYAVMNMLEFGFYLGIPLLFVFAKEWPESWKGSSVWFRFGLVNLTFFLLIGIFQGEVGRIWLFIAPFFLFFRASFFAPEKKYFFSALLSLLAAQNIAVQLLFYTFW